jgi:hypothetical protein
LNTLQSEAKHQKKPIKIPRKRDGRNVNITGFSEELAYQNLKKQNKKISREEIHGDAVSDAMAKKVISKGFGA